MNRIISESGGLETVKKRRNGLPYLTTVKNIWGETVDVFPSVDAARQKYYPSHSAGYLSALMFYQKNNTFVDDALGLSFHREQGGRCKNEKRYRVYDKRSGKETIYENGTKMLKELKHIGGTSFYKQLKLYGNFKSDLYEIYPIL